MITKDITEEEWKSIADIGEYIGYIRGDETICLDGNFSLADLKRIIIWFEERQNLDKST